jgi:branched-chain amino acid transport system permease protein
MPSWQEFQPFVVVGLALGGVFSLSGVGLVVLYRATGVLNLAFGAVGAFGALIAWQLINAAGASEWLAYTCGVLTSAVLTTAYGMTFGSMLANRPPLVKAVASLGLTLGLLGAMDMIWSASGGATRTLVLPTDNGGFAVGQVQVTWTQVTALAIGVAITCVTGVMLRYTKLGVAMRAMANDREITATLGVPVRRVEAAAWFGCGLLSGVAGILLADLVALDASTLTFFVISALAAVLIGQFRSIYVTFVAAIVVGLVNAIVTPIAVLSGYRDLAPFALAGIAIVLMNRHRTAVVGGERLQ